MKTPKSPSEITAEWLNDVLLSKNSSSEIVSIEIDNNFGPWSLLGKAIRVVLNYADEESKPKSVIVKFQVSCSDPEREGKIYHLLSETDVSYTPQLYGEFNNGNLVLEDMSPTCSVIKSNFTITQVRNIVSILADLSNRFFEDSRVPKDDIRHFINSININMEQSWDIFRHRYQEQLDQEEAVFVWMWKNSEIISGHYGSSPHTLNHGDVNKSNMLFTNDENDKPVLIDWQLAGQKVLPFDLSYFLVKSLTVEQRRNHEDALLNEFYGQLSENIRTSYSYDNMVLDYRACVTRSMLSAVTRVGPRFDSQPDRFKGADELAARVITAVKDLKPVEAIQELEKRS